MKSGTRILVVDDDPAIVELFSTLLRGEGYEIGIAARADECLRAAAERRPDVVLLDVILPDMSGVEVCRLLKSDAALADTFVVLVSGHANDSTHKVKGFEAGADDYLTKPIEPSEFLARIRTIVRLRHATAALRASEHHYRQLMEILPDAVASIDLQGQLTAVNPQATAMLGYADASELLQKTVFDLTLQDDHERARSDIASTLQTGVLRNAEYTLLTATGSRVLVEVSGASLKGTRGQPVGLVGVLRDITERKRMEAQLQMLAHAVECTTEPICITDLADRFTFVNRAFQESYGYAKEEILGLTPRILFSPKNPPSLLTEILEQTRSGGWRGEVIDQRKNGTEFPVFLSTSQIRDETGRLIGLMGVAEDITERKRAEEQIRLLADAVESTQELICITDHEDRITFANRAFLDTYGYRLEEILGRTPGFIQSPRNPEGLTTTILQQTLAGGWNGEILNVKRDGTEFPILLSTSLINTADGRMLGLVGVARDISEQKRAENQIAAFSLLGYRLSAATDPKEAAEILFGIVSELFAWDAGFLHLYLKVEDMSVPVLAIDTVAGQRMPLPSSSRSLDPSPMMRLVMKEGAQLIDRAGGSPPLVDLAPFGDNSRSSDSLMFVPIHSGSEILGILCIQSYSPRAYSQDDLRILQALADHCGNTLHRIRVAQALRDAEAKYRSIFENATEGIFRSTTDGRLIEANPALARMFGYQSPEEFVSAVSDIARQLYVTPSRRKDLKRLLETQADVQGFEIENYRNDGTKIWISLNGHAVRDASGAVLYYEGTIQDITERKAAEAELARTQRLQRAILDNIPDPAWLKDTEGHILACNGALASLYGTDQQAIMGKVVSEFLPEAAPRLTREDNTVMQLRKPCIFEGTLTDGLGRARRFETVKSPTFNDMDEVSGTVGIARDISARHDAERLLQLQNDFGNFLASTKDLSAVLGRLLELAVHIEAIDCGVVYLPDEPTGDLLLAAYQGVSAGFLKDALRFPAGSPEERRLRTGETIYWHRGELGDAFDARLEEERLLVLDTIPILQGGRRLAVVNVGSHGAREIPAGSRLIIETLAARAGGAIARIRAEQSLRANRQILGRTLESLSYAVFLIDAASATIQECNPAATLIFRYTRDELIGLPLARLDFEQAMIKRFGEPPNPAARDEKFRRDFEFKMRRKDGTLVPTEGSLTSIKDEAGQVTSWVGVVRDITELKRAGEELRRLPQRIMEAQEAERQRVARELHDGVNQVIASAKMRLLKVHDTVTALSPSARVILARSCDLLVQALEENRRIAHNLRPSDLDELGLTAACRNFCKEVQARTNLAVTCHIGRINQCLTREAELNLFRIIQEALTNVEKHARARTVRVRICFKGDTLVLTIRDDGRGFDPRASRSGRVKGHGIGLTNMRERAALLGGDCEIEAVPNQGTTITVLVPCKKSG